MKQSSKTEIARLFNFDIENDVTAIHPKYICDNCRRKIDIIKNNSQKKVVATEILTFEFHSDNCRHCLKHNRLNEHQFLMKDKYDIIDQETPHLPTEELTIHQIICSWNKFNIAICSTDSNIIMLISACVTFFTSFSKFWYAFHIFVHLITWHQSIQWLHELHLCDIQFL